MNDLFALAVYIFVLFLLGLGNAIVIYHILHYRDPDDASGFVLGVYIIIVLAVLVTTTLLLNWNTIFGGL